MVGSGLQPEPLVWLSIMPSIRISKEFALGIYYLTFTVREESGSLAVVVCKS